MQQSKGFERVSDTELERLGEVSFRRFKEQVAQRYADQLSPEEHQQDYQIVVIPETTLVLIRELLPKLRWITNVGAVRDGHRRYYGVYAGNRKALGKVAGVNLKAGRPEGTGKGYGRTYQFRLERDTLAQVAQLVAEPTQKGKRSAWLRFFILKGAEALSQGSPWTEIEMARADFQSLTERIETVRLTSEQQTEVERWRNDASDYELMKRLFAIGVAFAKSKKDSFS